MVYYMGCFHRLLLDLSLYFTIPAMQAGMQFESILFIVPVCLSGVRRNLIGEWSIISHQEAGHSFPVSSCASLFNVCRIPVLGI